MRSRLESLIPQNPFNKLMSTSFLQRKSALNNETSSRIQTTAEELFIKLMEALPEDKLFVYESFPSEELKHLIGYAQAWHHCFTVRSQTKLENILSRLQYILQYDSNWPPILCLIDLTIKRLKQKYNLFHLHEYSDLIKIKNYFECFFNQQRENPSWSQIRLLTFINSGTAIWLHSLNYNTRKNLLKQYIINELDAGNIKAFDLFIVFFDERCRSGEENFTLDVFQKSLNQFEENSEFTLLTPKKERNFSLSLIYLLEPLPIFNDDMHKILSRFLLYFLFQNHNLMNKFIKANNKKELDELLEDEDYYTRKCFRMLHEGLRPYLFSCLILNEIFLDYGEDSKVFSTKDRAFLHFQKMNCEQFKKLFQPIFSSEEYSTLKRSIEANLKLNKASVTKIDS